MPVVSVRLPDEDVAFLRERKENLSAFARKAIHDAVQRERMLMSLAELDRLVQKQQPAKTSSEDLIRSDRDSH